MADRKTPKFTKRDFQWLAEILNAQYEWLEYSADLAKYTTYEREITMYEHWRFIQGFSKSLAATNPAYQREKFLRAAMPDREREKWYLGVQPNPAKKED
ncbi:hypothetical protein UFOVP1344_31 [uncultured Caudovirales phage]|uniref:Uncharacterized protein n=1 Tax=uncultured Caudovirales phage TaxID=2100421 RepID=A0A6J5S1I2_9CAUD|nr:hypothetical protein UFOVP1005_31 [uncultured Caudovirales phage]CAB4200186.1 hypothetical protein UFOVP1344_31 [uncultured Caudovirales phage]CAB4218115.1 hypothetical protein UFOVP1602_9 [uncultured Caudovirales phage]